MGRLVLSPDCGKIAFINQNARLLSVVDIQTREKGVIDLSEKYCENQRFVLGFGQ
jgi:hypothetical protein